MQEMLRFLVLYSLKSLFLVVLSSKSFFQAFKFLGVQISLGGVEKLSWGCKIFWGCAPLENQSMFGSG
jgi:hypothetical protein